MWNSAAQQNTTAKTEISTDQKADTPGIEEARAKDHDGLTGALLELHLDGAELAVDDGHHALDLFGRDRPCAGLFPQQVHHVIGELTASLFSNRFEDCYIHTNIHSH